MYCRASATLAITSASRITVIAQIHLKTNQAANLTTRGRVAIAYPLQSSKVSEIRMRRRWTALLLCTPGAGFCLALCMCVVWRGSGAAGGGLTLHECRLAHPLRLASVAARCGVLKVPEDRSN